MHDTQQQPDDDRLAELNAAASRPKPPAVSRPAVVVAASTYCRQEAPTEHACPRILSFRVRLVRNLLRALRHNPAAYSLSLDAEGWTDLQSVLDNFRQHDRRWRRLAYADLEALIETDDSGRFECRDGRIRALYGHSIPGVCTSIQEAPPATLYHATATTAIPMILQTGLRPMGRCYVHLTSNIGYARKVGLTHEGTWAVCEVDAQRAFQEGTPFYRANWHVWQTLCLAPRFIHVIETVSLSSPSISTHGEANVPEDAHS